MYNVPALKLIGLVGNALWVFAESLAPGGDDDDHDDLKHGDDSASDGGGSGLRVLFASRVLVGVAGAAVTPATAWMARALDGGGGELTRAMSAQGAVQVRARSSARSAAFRSSLLACDPRDAAGRRRREEDATR